MQRLVVTEQQILTCMHAFCIHGPSLYSCGSVVGTTRQTMLVGCTSVQSSHSYLKNPDVYARCMHEFSKGELVVTTSQANHCSQAVVSQAVVTTSHANHVFMSHCSAQFRLWSTSVATACWSRVLLVCNEFARGCWSTTSYPACSWCHHDL